MLRGNTRKISLGKHTTDDLVDGFVWAYDIHRAAFILQTTLRRPPTADEFAQAVGMSTHEELNQMEQIGDMIFEELLRRNMDMIVNIAQHLTAHRMRERGLIQAGRDIFRTFLTKYHSEPNKSFKYRLWIYLIKGLTREAMLQRAKRRRTFVLVPTPKAIRLRSKVILARNLLYKSLARLPTIDEVARQSRVPPQIVGVLIAAFWLRPKPKWNTDYRNIVDFRGSMRQHYDQAIAGYKLHMQRQIISHLPRPHQLAMAAYYTLNLDGPPGKSIPFRWRINGFEAQIAWIAEKIGVSPQTALRLLEESKVLLELGRRERFFGRAQESRAVRLAFEEAHEAIATESDDLVIKLQRVALELQRLISQDNYFLTHGVKRVMMFSGFTKQSKAMT